MKKLTHFLLLVCPFFYGIAQDISVVSQHEDISQTYVKEEFEALIDSSDVYYDTGEYKKSLQTNILLLKKALANQDYKYIHEGYRNLGYDYLMFEDTLLAEESFEKAQKYAQLAQNDEATALSFMDMANLYSSIKLDYKNAAKYHDKSILLFARLNDSANLAKAHYNTALTALEFQKLDKAYGHIVSARKIGAALNDETFTIGVDLLTGEYYFLREKYIMADRYLIKAIEAAKKEPLYRELESAYFILGESYFKQERYKEAYTTREKYEDYYDINQEEIRSEDSNTMSAKFQLEQYRKEVEAAEIQNQLQLELVKNKTHLNLFLLIVMFIFIALLIVLYTSYRRRKQMVQILKVKNKEALIAKETSEKLTKAKSTFFSTISHELRTPLYGVIGLSSILLEDKSLSTHKKDLKALKFSADYLLALINDVLQINKIESNGYQQETSKLDLSDLVESITSSFAYMQMQNNNTFHVQLDEDIPKSIEGNAVQLSQVLMNLVGNACKFTQDGAIFIKAQLLQSNATTCSIEFSIRDTGMGIPKEKQESIFDEFSQVDALDNEYQGSGLGLPIVKKILNKIGSSISLESTEGLGTKFTFALQFKVSASENKEQDSVAADYSMLKNKNILVVEDNKINQIVTQKILGNYYMKSDLAENGQEAVLKVKNNDYDLILMDINMPVKNGIEATKEIRTFNKQVPILALTAVEIDEIRYSIFEAGMNDIIVKPYDVTKFLTTLRTNMSFAGKSSPTNHLKAI